MRHKGFVLIFVLWVLSFLTVLAVGLAAGIRQKIVLVEKLEQRSRSSYLLEAAIKHAAVYITNQIQVSGEAYTPSIKTSLHNNPIEFGHFYLAEDVAIISYDFPGQERKFGLVDEERKININITTIPVLSRLIERALSMKVEVADKFAQDILDWRQLGESQLVGFFSDEYYQNLTYPYPKKNSSYETLDELLLVKGMTKEKYKKLIKYVTIYGSGKVNINTVSAEVLYALGLEDPLVQRIIEARQGKDGIEGTIDDVVFLKTFDIATEVNKIVKLESQEIYAIDRLNQQGLFTTNSVYFLIEAQAQLSHSVFSKSARAVFSSRENKFIYWNERGMFNL